jgi:hypothetical protein
MAVGLSLEIVFKRPLQWDWRGLTLKSCLVQLKSSSLLRQASHTFVRVARPMAGRRRVRQLTSKLLLLLHLQ